MSVWFDSRDVRYKDPFGAVSCGAEVRFALGADEPLEACCLLVRQEFAGNLFKEGHVLKVAESAQGSLVGVEGAGADLVRLPGAAARRLPPLAGTQWLRR